MNKEIRSTTMSDFEKITKILADFTAQTSCAKQNTKKEKLQNPLEVLKNARQNNLLQNFC